jgi:hypothetical protein
LHCEHGWYLVAITAKNKDVLGTQIRRPERID